MANTIRTTLHLTPGTRAMLEQLAASSHRTLAQMVRVLVEQEAAAEQRRKLAERQGQPETGQYQTPA